MRYSSAFLGISLAIGISASPTPSSIAGAITAAECKAVDVIVQVLELYPSASPWCSSFLGIQTATSTVTNTVTVPTTTTYSTITGTGTVNAAAVTVSSTITSTVTTCDVANLVNKRDMGKQGGTTPTTTSHSSSTPATTFHTSSTSVKTTSTASPNGGILAALVGYQNSAISTACECLSITTPTVTATVFATATNTIISTSDLAATTTATPTSTTVFTATVTATACPTPDTSCNNAGIQYGVWYNSQTQTDFSYPNFDPTIYKSDSAEFSGNSSTDMIGPIDTVDCTTTDCSPGYIYSTYTESVGLVAVDHRGYLFAPLDGDYTFTINDDDNIVLIWVGSIAYSGWTRDNAVLENTFPNSPVSTTVTLSGSEWFPIRVMYANGGGPGTFSISITAPDGTEIAGSDETSSPFLVQYSCDGTSPMFPAWNSET